MQGANDASSWPPAQMDRAFGIGGRRAFLGGLVQCAAGGAAMAQADAQEEMIAVIAQRAYTAVNAIGRTSIDPRVIEAMRRVPRQAFVPEALAANAYDDRPLPIGHGQTISQPFIVALMTDMLNTEPGHVVLEVGTGSGYQAAILSRLVRNVHSIEILAPLASLARRRLRDGGFANVTVHLGDGYFGVPAAAPFDGIIATAAARSIPPPLIDQLRPGGRMVIPVGNPFAAQHLMLVEKARDGSVRTRRTLPVHFVPFTRAQ